MRGAETPQMKAHAWLEARGLDPELAARMGWAGSKARDGSVWIEIPFIRNGATTTTQYRRLDEKAFRFEKDSEASLWNADCLEDETLSGQPLVIAEGALDGLALIQSGFPRTIAVPGWSDRNFAPDRYRPFLDNEEAIKRAGTIVVAQHDDDAGAAMLRGVANFFDECDVRYVAWPGGANDANDALLAGGAGAVANAIRGARPLDPPGGLITGFTDLPPRPRRKIWRIGDASLDRLMAFRSREVSLLTGTPSAGKTTFITFAAHRLVQAHGIRIGLGLFETDPTEVERHLLLLSGVGPRASEAARRDALAALDRHYRLFHRIDEGEEMHGMAWLKRMIYKLAARDGCNLIVVDPWNEIEHQLEPGETMATYANFALMRLRQWADRYDIHIVLLAHPKKMEPGRKPLGYDVADAAAFANKPGMGWTVHLEDDEAHGAHVSLTCWKVRNRYETGCRPGLIRLAFDERAMTYRPLAGRASRGGGEGVPSSAGARRGSAIAARVLAEEES